ncbi:MAG TPA: hypothetical protein VGN20_14070 [Mucilaginibacter sp.]
MGVNHHHAALCGLLLTAWGLYVRYRIGRRRFCRRGIAGLQQFRSYRSALLIRLMESLINLLGAACIIAGAALILIAYF